MNPQRLPCRARGRGPALLALAILLLAAGAAEARPQRELAGVDLRVRPGDLKPAPRPVVPYAAPAADEAPVYALSDQVAATDRPRRSAIPDRRRDENLLGIGPEGGLIEELLENQTIPIFRVTVEPPF